MAARNTIAYLSEDDLVGLDIKTGEIVEIIESLIVACSQNTVWNAPKAVILPPDGRYMMAALAAANDPPLLTVKTAVLNPRNLERGLPQINALVTMLDSETGNPLAIIEGNWITAVRTAALSAVAAKYMAPVGAKIAGFIGTGVQARSHLKAFSDLYPLEEIRIFGRGQKNIDGLCQYAESLDLNPVVCSSAQQAICEADLNVTSVSYSADLEPFLDANWLKPGSFAAVADLAVPWIKESFSIFDQISIDDLEQEATLPNKLCSPEFVTGDLSDLVLGKFKGRKHTIDRTAFIFRGHALGDLALSALAYQKAKDLGRI